MIQPKFHNAGFPQNFPVEMFQGKSETYHEKVANVNHELGVSWEKFGDSNHLDMLKQSPQQARSNGIWE